MKKNTLILISIIAFIFLVIILIFGSLAYTTLNNNNSNNNYQIDDEKINQKVDELVEEKLREKENEKKEAEKKQDEKKVEKNKENYISTDEAISGNTNVGVSVSGFSCTVTGKEKKIPSNVDPKSKGGMISCEEKKYRVYVPFEETFNSLEIGDEQFFPNVKWIKSNLYFLASVAAS